ncbi:MAG: sialate O-acetylesterase, partial [Opitutales bacterium]
MKNLATLSVFFLGAVSFVFAKISTPAIFGSNMVLQRDHACPVWGWADPNSSVSLTFAGKTYDAKADQSGNWRITLSPLEESSDPQNMIISYGKNLPDSLVYENILVGEVWLCSGQSNMQWAINRSDDADLEALSANYPNLRLISVPQVGTQIPQNNFKGSWAPASPDTAASFSAVGFLFGSRLHQILGVPVGLINNAWGGSACEAWIPRDRLRANPMSLPYLKMWEEKEKTYHYETLLKAYEEKLVQWQAEQKAGKTKVRAPQKPRNDMTGQHRPTNLYHGVLSPIIG